MTMPDHLAYFNERVGGPEQGARLVTDSNLNWGQDNRRLAEFVRERKISAIGIFAEAMNPDIYNYYKIPWRPIETTELLNPQPGFYAFGIGYYTSKQQDPAFWFKDRQPSFRVGKTFYVFEVPGE